jgi:hypothetical protein
MIQSNDWAKSLHESKDVTSYQAEKKRLTLLDLQMHMVDKQKKTRKT